MTALLLEAPSDHREHLGDAPDPLEQRSWRLANGLLGLGLSSGDRIALLCCDLHADDFLVAYAAVRKLAAVPVLLSEEAAERSALLPPWIRPQAVLACEEGCELWQRGGGRGLVITDAPFMLWWKALEARASAEEWDLDADPRRADEIDLIVDVTPDGGLRVRALPSHLSTMTNGSPLVRVPF